jgi:hypothetical protein
MLREHNEMKVLAVFTEPPSYLFFAEGRVDNLSKLHGRTVEASGDWQSLASKALDMHPVPFSLRNGQPAGTGRISTASQMVRSDVDSKFRSATMLPGGLSTASYVFAMSVKAWAGISAEDRRAIDAISGEAVARAFGRSLDAVEWKANMKKRAEGVVFYSADDQVTAQPERRLAPVDKAWLTTARRAGVARPERTLVNLRKTITELELAE